MESRKNVWEMPQDMGNGAGIWGGRQAAWGAKITLKPRTWELGRPADFVKIKGRRLVWGGRPTVWENVKACDCRGTAKTYGE